MDLFIKDLSYNAAFLEAWCFNHHKKFKERKSLENSVVFSMKIGKFNFYNLKTLFPNYKFKNPKELLEKTKAIDPKKLTRAGISFSKLKSEVFKNCGNKTFKSIFRPKISDKMDRFLREAYVGGFVWLDEMKANKILKNIVSLDINSLYPYIMTFNMPDFSSGKKANFFKKDVFQVCKIKIKSLSIKPGCVPIFPKKYDFLKPGKVFSEKDLIFNVQTITNLDYYLIKKNYNINFDFIEGYEFPISIHAPFRKFINEYYSKKMRAKAQDDFDNYYFYKICLNSCYGKFGQKRLVPTGRPVLKNGIVRWKKTGLERSKFHGNILIADYIAARARERLYQLYQWGRGLKGYEPFYMDTDSVHFISTSKKHAFSPLPKSMLFHQREIGYPKIEHQFKQAKYFREKAYFGQKKDGNWDLACAGVDDEGKSMLLKQIHEKGLEGLKLPLWTTTRGLRRTKNGYQEYRAPIEIGKRNEQIK